MDTSYLTTQVATIIGQLHNLFDEIGVPSHERESRESALFSALSETLHDHLKRVTLEKNELAEEARRVIKTIKQMEASLEDPKPKDNYSIEDDSLQVTVPLAQCLRGLKEKQNTIARIHRERFEQVKKLVLALESYSSHLEPSFVKITLPPTSENASIPPTFDLSPSYVTKLDNEFSRVYEEYNRRITNVKTLSEEVVNLWAELGTPQAQTDSSVVQYYRDSPEQLGLHENDLSRLRSKRDKLVDEKRSRERKLKELRSLVEGLWDRLGIEDLDRKRFHAGTRGCGLRVINDLEAELDRLNILKRQNLHLFVEEARVQLQALWDGLYFSEEEMLEFAPAFTEVFSDALLSAHEDEIARLEALKEQRLPIIQLVDRHRSLIKDRDDLAASSQDASRLMLRGQKGEKRDPTRLLREEKMRKRITKDLPKVEAELRKALDVWEGEYGRPFLVCGERYHDELSASGAKPMPPRSKTPSGPPPGAKSVKGALPPPSRSGSVIRGSQPPRAAPPTAGSIRRNPMASSTSSAPAGPTSPSKIPSRMPLSSMRHGGNSPERHTVQRPGVSSALAPRKMGPPAMAPPPKMRELQQQYHQQPVSTPASYNDYENFRPASVASSTSEVVRPISPEDVYSDARFHHAPASRYHSSATISSSATTHHHHHRQPEPSQHQQQRPYEQPSYLEASETRQISGTSMSSTAVSGSENWETYDDASEPEVDVSGGYYAKLKAAKGKRGTPEGGIGGTGTVKRVKAGWVEETF